MLSSIKGRPVSSALKSLARQAGRAGLCDPFKSTFHNSFYARPNRNCIRPSRCGFALTAATSGSSRCCRKESFFLIRQNKTTIDPFPSHLMSRERPYVVLLRTQVDRLVSLDSVGQTKSDWWRSFK